MADKFVKMTKDGETIEVHPSVVEDHQRLGWKVVEEKAEEKTEEKSETGTQKPEDKKKSTK